MTRSASWVAGLIACPIALFGTACGMARAADTGDLYAAETIVTGQGEENRALGFAECLKYVLVKVSGEPGLAGDPGVAVMAGEAGNFVREFRYRDRMSGIPVHDEEGTRKRPYDLTVVFEPAKIDAALRSLGRVPWTAPRPRLVIFVSVTIGAATYVLTEDGDRGRGMVGAVAGAADRLGMPMTLPSQAGLAGAGLGFANLAGTDLPTLDAVAQTIGGDLALRGSMVWSDAALSWIAEWELGSEGTAYRWRSRDPSFDGAFRSAAGGALRILSGNGSP